MDEPPSSEMLGGGFHMPWIKLRPFRIEPGQAGVNLQSLYDYCRTVEQELETFGFDEKRLVVEALASRLLRTGANGV